jgi:hypothetical protein
MAAAPASLGPIEALQHSDRPGDSGEEVLLICDVLAMLIVVKAAHDHPHPTRNLVVLVILVLPRPFSEYLKDGTLILRSVARTCSSSCRTGLASRAFTSPMRASSNLIACSAVSGVKRRISIGGGSVGRRRFAMPRW